MKPTTAAPRARIFRAAAAILAISAACVHGQDKWSSAPWTSDADSGVIKKGAYLMAVNLGGDAIEINGIEFVKTHPVGDNYVLKFEGGQLAKEDTNNQITGNSNIVSSTYAHGMITCISEFKNLTPGATYETTFYSTGWKKNPRPYVFSSDGVSAVIDQNSYGENKGIRISHTFIASAGERTITITPKGHDEPIHICAISNRMVSPRPDKITTTELVSDPAVFSSSGRNLKFTATVKEDGKPATEATGVVMFRIDDTLAATEKLVNGTAVFTTNTLDSGAHNIRATYVGDRNFASSQSSVTHTNITPKMLAFTFNSHGPATIRGNEIFAELRHGTDITKLTPHLRFTADATCSPPTNVQQDFSKPVTYTLTSTLDSQVVTRYTVTARVAPFVTFSTRGDGKKLATFAGGSGSWTVPAGVSSVEVLVIGGGGAGGGQSCGAGAGGMFYNPKYAVSPGEKIAVQVGLGGIGGKGSQFDHFPGTAGGDSRFGNIIAYGGIPGGSYGEGGAQGGYSTDNGKTVKPGNPGGTAPKEKGRYASGGGAGAAGKLEDSSPGGIGRTNSITGTSIYYAGGGGSNPKGSGGLGGGGSAVEITPEDPSDIDGVSGTGGGGGGGWGGINDGADGGGDGGSGIVIVAYDYTGTKTTTQLVSNLNPTSQGQKATFVATITVKGDSKTKVSGSVTFREGNIVLGVAELVGGTATFTTDSLSAGSHPITATYHGNEELGSSTGQVTHTVKGTGARTYQDWAGEFRLKGTSEDDDDGDGLNNFQEFAFGLDPTNGNSSNPVTDITTFRSQGTFSYTRLTGEGRTYTVWTSPDLLKWDGPLEVTEKIGPANDLGIATVRAQIVSPPPDGKFLRVQAEPLN